MRKYAGFVLFCLVFAGLYLGKQGLSYGALSDAFAIPGMLLLCAAALLRLRAAGALDGVVRLWRSVLFAASAAKRPPKRMPNCRPLALTGTASLTLGLLFLALLYGVP